MVVVKLVSMVWIPQIFGVGSDFRFNCNEQLSYLEPSSSLAYIIYNGTCIFCHLV